MHSSYYIYVCLSLYKKVLSGDLIEYSFGTVSICLSGDKWQLFPTVYNVSLLLSTTSPLVNAQ